MKNRKRLTLRQISILCVALLALSLLPLLLLGHFNVPQADDFSSGARGHLVWTATHSVWAVLVETARYTKELYFTWSGDLFTMFFTVLQPAVFGEDCSAIVPYLMIGLLCAGTFYLSYSVLVKALRIRPALWGILTSGLLFLEIQCMVNGVEGFYWYTGAVNYMFPYALNLFLLGFLCRSFLAGSRKKQILYTALSFLFECMAGAGNYTIILNMLLVNLTVLAALLLKKERGRLWQILLPFSGFLAFFVLNVAAPGNAVRGATTEASFGAVKSILISLYYTLVYPVKEWTDWTILAGMVFLTPFIWHAVKRVRFSFPAPLLAAAYSYCFLSTAFTAPLFGSGNIEAGRIQDMIFLQYLLLLFCNLFYGLGWLARHFGVQEKTEEAFAPGGQNGGPGSSVADPGETLSRNEGILALCLAGFLLFGGAMTVKTAPDHYLATSALRSLAMGEAQAFRAQFEERRELLLDPDRQELVFSPYEAQPNLLYFSDIKPDEKEWENLAMCRFYGKEKIVLEEVGKEEMIHRKEEEKIVQQGKK